VLHRADGGRRPSPPCARHPRLIPETRSMRRPRRASKSTARALSHMPPPGAAFARSGVVVVDTHRPDPQVRRLHARSHAEWPRVARRRARTRAPTPRDPGPRSRITGSRIRDPRITEPRITDPRIHGPRSTVPGSTAREGRYVRLERSSREYRPARARSVPRGPRRGAYRPLGGRYGGHGPSCRPFRPGAWRRGPEVAHRDDRVAVTIPA
jgi:hypothetical protein